MGVMRDLHKHFDPFRTTAWCSAPRKTQEMHTEPSKATFHSKSQFLHKQSQQQFQTAFMAGQHVQTRVGEQTLSVTICFRDLPPARLGVEMVLGPIWGLSVIADATTSFCTMRRAMTSRRWLMVLISSGGYISSSAARPACTWVTLHPWTHCNLSKRAMTVRC